jgi:hypothetical protein
MGGTQFQGRLLRARAGLEADLGVVDSAGAVLVEADLAAVAVLAAVAAARVLEDRKASTRFGARNA